MKHARAVRTGIQIGLLAASYFAAAKAGLLLATVGAQVTLVWPPTGIALAAVLLGGLRLWPGVTIGATLVNLSTGVSLATACGIGIGNTLEAVLAVLLLRRLGFKPSLDRLRDVYALLLLAAGLSTIAAATVGVASLILSGVQSWSAAPSAWGTWWLGDALGDVVVAPVLLVWATRPGGPMTRRCGAEAALLLAATVAAGLSVFLGWFGSTSIYLHLVYLVFPLLLWATLRFGPPGVVLFTLVVSGLTLWGTVHATGGLLETILVRNNLLNTQLFMGIVGVTGLILAAAMSDRESALTRVRALNAELEQRVDERTAQLLAANTDLRTSEERLRAILAATPDLLFTLSRQGEYRSYHAPSLDALYRPPEQFLGRNIREVLPAALAEQTLHHIRRTLDTGTTQSFEYELSLGTRPAFFEARVVVSGPDEVLTIIRDITARRRAEDRFRDLLEAAPDAIVTSDAAGRIVLVNAQTEAMFGHCREAVVGQPVDLLLPEWVRAQQVQHQDRDHGDSRTRPTSSGLELRGRRKDGGDFPIEVSLSPLSSEGEMLVTAVIRDISARKEAEQALREQAELLDLAHDAIIVRDLAPGTILYWNKGAEAMYGWTKEEAIGQTTGTLLQTRHPQPLDTIMATFLPQGRWSGELEHATRDGRTIIVESHWTLRRNAEDQPSALLEINTDITRRTAAAAALHESESRLSTVIDSAPIILFALDTAGVVTLCEGKGLDRLGLVPDAVVGHPVSVLYRDDPAILVAVRRALVGQDSGVVSQLDSVALDTHLVALRDERGDVQGVIGVATDVTERVRAEAAERALRSRDEFLSVAAHEFKTPLTSLRGFTQLVLGYLKGGRPVAPERMQLALRQIESQTDKVNRLVDHLLDVTRLEAGRLTLERRETDLTQLAHEVGAVAQAQTDAHTLVVTAPSAAPAWVDPLRLEQVLTNLVSNAIKYSPHGGTITITVVPDSPAEVVQLTVRDQGLGIPEEHRAHIFDRFYQAHASTYRSGLGLGLYICQQIVALHGGQLTAEFPPEGGSLFIVSLPSGRDTPELTTKEEARSHAKTGIGGR